MASIALQNGTREIMEGPFLQEEQEVLHTNNLKWRGRF
jgi:hypothetical protein